MVDVTAIKKKDCYDRNENVVRMWKRNDSIALL